VIEFRLLGPLEVWRDGALVPITSRRQRAVLALLLLRAGTVVSTDELIDQLWPHEPPRSAKASLHNHVSRLRKLVGETVIETVPSGYRANVPADALDVGRVEHVLESSRGATAADRSAMLRDALQRWRGLPLVEFPVEPFVQSEIIRLEELRLLTLEERIEADLELERHAALVPELEAVVEQQPLRERFWQQLMIALYRSGRQADALATYRRAHDTFVRELGLEPSPQLKDLQRAILLQEPRLTVRDPVTDDLFRRAVDELPVADAARGRVLLDYAAAIWRLGERRRANLAVEEAARRAASAGDVVLERRALLQLSLNRMLEQATSLNAHAAEARRAARVFAEADELDALADALLQEAYMTRDAGCAHESAQLAEEAASVAERIGNDDIRRRAAGYLATALAIGPTPVPDALRRCPLGNGEATYGVLCGRGYLLVQSGQKEAGLALVERGIEVARSRGLPSSLSGAMHWIAFCHETLGNQSAAANSLRTAHDLTQAVDERSALALSAARLARALAALGEIDEAEHFVSQAEYIGTPEDYSIRVYCDLARALIDDNQGQHRRAQEHARAAVETASKTDWLNVRALTHEDLATTSLRNRAEARRAALALYQRKGNSAAVNRLRAR
jgi:DNA-binding SARP family transcriptional activator